MNVAGILQWCAVLVCVALFCRALWLTKATATGAAPQYRHGVLMARSASIIAAAMVVYSGARGDWFAAASWTCAGISALLGTWMLQRMNQMFASRDQAYARQVRMQNQLSQCATIDAGDAEDA
jgi:hypothetical protein